MTEAQRWESRKSLMGIVSLLLCAGAPDAAAPTQLADALSNPFLGSLECTFPGPWGSLMLLSWFRYRRGLLPEAQPGLLLGYYWICTLMSSSEEATWFSSASASLQAHLSLLSGFSSSPVINIGCRRTGLFCPLITPLAWGVWACGGHSELAGYVTQWVQFF